MRGVYRRAGCRPSLWVLTVLLLGTLALPQLSMADDTEEVLQERFSGEGRWGIVAAGQGMHRGFRPGPGEIEIDVPGTAVEIAYLYWSGYAPLGGGDDTVILTRQSDGASVTLVADPATGTHGPKPWSGDNYYYVYVAEATSLVRPGQDTYSVSDFGGAMVRRDGAGLMVVYEDPDLPVREVVIRDGLDRFFRVWGEGPRGETAANCVVMTAQPFQRRMEFWMFAAEIVRLGEEEPRPNALWYLTGTDADPIPTDLVNAPTDGPVIGTLIQGPPDYPFGSHSDPQWDAYTNEVTIPAGHSWVCLQVESARDPRDATWRPASGILMATGRRMRIEEPTPTPTYTPTPTDTATPTPTGTTTGTTTPTPTGTTTLTSTPSPTPPPPVVPEASTLGLLGGSALTLAGYAALQVRARRHRR
jgi:hypothetical protein